MVTHQLCPRGYHRLHEHCDRSGRPSRVDPSVGWGRGHVREEAGMCTIVTMLITCQSQHFQVGGLITMRFAALLLFSLVAFHCGGVAAPPHPPACLGVGGERSYQGGRCSIVTMSITGRSLHSSAGGLLIKIFASVLLFPLLAFHCGGAAAPPHPLASLGVGVGEGSC